MRPTVTAKTHLPAIPSGLFDVALIDGPAIAAAGGESISSFLDGVRRTAQGELRPGEVPYPQAVIKRVRFTRFLMADARRWLIARAQAGDTAASETVTDRARRASAAARKPKAVAKAAATRRSRASARNADRVSG
jgi:hypothetical protein